MTAPAVYWDRVALERLVAALRQPAEDCPAGQPTTCPHCAYTLQGKETWGYRESQGLEFTICPRCGGDWPD
jgi:hypothetical protein